MIDEIKDILVGISSEKFLGKSEGDEISLDSIETIQFVVEVETRFGIEISDDLLVQFNQTTIENIVDLINELNSNQLEIV